MKFIRKKFTGFEFPTLIIGKFGLQVIEEFSCVLQDVNGWHEVSITAGNFG